MTVPVIHYNYIIGV